MPLLIVVEDEDLPDYFARACVHWGVVDAEAFMETLREDFCATVSLVPAIAAEVARLLCTQATQAHVHLVPEDSSPDLQATG